MSDTETFEVPSAAARIQGNGMPAGPRAGFVARQPIVTRDEEVVGYELLFRDGTEDYFRSADPETASKSVLDSSIVIGLDVLCGHRRAFVNCTRELLLQDYITLLPCERTVVEVLESVPPDDQVQAACLRLKEARYMIALDDFVVNDPREPLTDFADIIKIDLQMTPIDDATAMVKHYSSRRCRMLAEKVETRDQFLAAKDAGFLYFQGYFFRHPELMQAGDIPTNRVNYLRLSQAVSEDEQDSNEVESVIKSEKSLSGCLPRYLN